MVLVSGFLAKIKKRHFWLEIFSQKIWFFTFGWVFPFSMVILWLQKIVLYVNNQIQSRNCKFRRTHPLRFCRKGGTPKTTKNCPKLPKMLFLPFWWPDIIKIVANYVWNKFWDISGQKVLIKKNFRFCTEKPWFFKKKFGNAQNPLFWAQKPGWMCFPSSFDDKSMK